MSTSQRESLLIRCTARIASVCGGGLVGELDELNDQVTSIQPASPPPPQPASDATRSSLLHESSLRWHLSLANASRVLLRRWSTFSLGLNVVSPFAGRVLSVVPTGTRQQTDTTSERRRVVLESQNEHAVIIKTSVDSVKIESRAYDKERPDRSLGLERRPDPAAPGSDQSTSKIPNPIPVTASIEFNNEIKTKADTESQSAVVLANGHRDGLVRDRETAVQVYGRWGHRCE